MRKPYIPSMTVKGTFFHGTAVSEPFDQFDAGYSDWGAVWFTEDRDIATEFADNAHRTGETEMYLYELSLRCSKIADISYELYKELDEYYGLDDPRDFIPILEKQGFRGWRMVGSIGSTIYDDYCVFDPTLITIKNYARIEA